MNGQVNRCLRQGLGVQDLLSWWSWGIVENLEDKTNITYNPQIQRLLLTFCVCPSRYFPTCTQSTVTLLFKKLSIHIVFKPIFFILT